MAAKADEEAQGGLLDTYKNVFLAGLATILPALLTIWVLTAGYGFVDRNFATPISDSLKGDVILGSDEGLRFAKWFWDLSLDLPTPRKELASRSSAEVAEDELRLAAIREEIERRYPDWIGFVLAVFGIFVVGFFTASFIGNALWRILESWILRIPIVKSVYPSAKQMVEFLVPGDDSKPQFNQVVAVQYPKQGQWTVGFVTGDGRPEVRNQVGRPFKTVFIPFAPTPISGFVVFATEDEIIPINMSVDEAFKFYISAGVIGSLGGTELPEIGAPQ